MRFEDTGVPNRPSTSRILWAGVDHSSDCWERSGYRDKNGYTRICRSPYRIYAHRAAWQEVTGEILLRSDLIGHTCDNPPCIRNDDEGWYIVNGILLPRRGHLFKGTNDDNMADMAAKGRAASGNRHSSRTHPERVRRGDDHPFRLYPEVRPWGDRNGSRKHPECLKRGEDNGNATLTARDVLEIRKLATNGMKAPTIAIQFKVDKSTIYDLLAGKTWRHI